MWFIVSPVICAAGDWFGAGEALRAEEVPGVVLGHEREVELARRETLRVLQVEEAHAARGGRRLVDLAIALLPLARLVVLRGRGDVAGLGRHLADGGGASGKGIGRGRASGRRRGGGVYRAGSEPSRRRRRRRRRGGGGRRRRGAGRGPGCASLRVCAGREKKENTERRERRDGSMAARGDGRSLEHVRAALLPPDGSVVRRLMRGTRKFWCARARFGMLCARQNGPLCGRFNTVLG